LFDVLGSITMTVPQSCSISFEDTNQHESVALYVSDEGQELINLAKSFCKTKNVPNLSSQEAIFQFCLYLGDLRNTHYPVPQHDLYLGMDGEDGDNSALGHHIILLVSGQEKFKKNLYD